MKTVNADQKQVAIISGGMGYLGKAIAIKLAKDGFIVALLFHNSPKEAVNSFIQQLNGKGHTAYFCDLTQPDLVKKTIIQISSDFGTISACIDTIATMPIQKRLHLCSSDELKTQFDSSVLCSFTFISACANKMKDQKNGIIIGITTASVVSQVGTRNRGAYTMMKFAIQGMLLVLREELTQFGVRVYSVAPGIMPGGLNAKTPRSFIQIAEEQSPTKQITSSENVADVISFLVSKKSQHITNLTLLIAPESNMM